MISSSLQYRERPQKVTVMYREILDLKVFAVTVVLCSLPKKQCYTETVTGKKQNYRMSLQKYEKSSLKLNFRYIKATVKGKLLGNNTLDYVYLNNIIFGTVDN